MNLSTYVCNAEGLYFLHLLFYPKIEPKFVPRLPTFSDMHGKKVYNTLELNVYDWLVGLNFRKRSDILFYMGWIGGFPIPLRTWSNGVGVIL